MWGKNQTHISIPAPCFSSGDKRMSLALWYSGRRDTDTAWGGQSRTQLRMASSCKGYTKGASVYPPRKSSSEAARRAYFWVIKAPCRGRGSAGTGSPSLHLDVCRVKGHSRRLLAAVAVWVQGRRHRWLRALGLQLPPGPHSPGRQ